MENHFREAKEKRVPGETEGRKEGRIKEQIRTRKRTALLLTLPLALRFNTWGRCCQG